ncbi:MAG: peptidoglycan-binding protein, partial [Candidatus Pacebacteria bacterium]|nr:peptidoglycan-binding protein [Candidatus Paceibacterota bacterium]
MSNLLKSKFFLGVLVVVGLVVAGSTASAAYMHTTLLKMGQSSSQVMSLQQTLNAGGFLVSTTGAGSPGMESMYFGAKTKAAVMAFQAAKGLSVDGVVGAQSGAALAAMTGGSVSYPAGCTSTTGFSTTTGM